MVKRYAQIITLLSLQSTLLPELDMRSKLCMGSILLLIHMGIIVVFLLYLLLFLLLKSTSNEFLLNPPIRQKYQHDDEELR